MTDEARRRAMLAAVLEVSSPPPDRCERSLAQLEARIVAAEPDVPEPLVSAPRGVGELVRFAVIAVAVAAAVLLIVRAVGTSVLQSRDAGAHPQATDVIAPPPVRPVEPHTEVPVREPATPPATLPDPIEPAAALPSTPRSSTSRSTPATTDPGDLAAEAALVRAAKAERDDLAALALLDRHAREFPRGHLAREREMLRAERLCARGRIDDARAVAERFLADGSDDPLARRMRRVCTER